MEPTIYSALSITKRHSSYRPALLGLNRKALNHSGLLTQIEGTVAALNAAGLGLGDRIAIVLANGPAAAACCLAVAAGAVAVPLNIGCTALEFKEHFAATGAKAVIVDDIADSSAINVAKEMKILVIRLFADPGMPAGVFALETGHGNRAKYTGFAAPEDIAFLLYTSGSTSRPKMAPLTHLNVCSGAANNAKHLQLTAADRCLCVTSMFFSQGILVSVFSPITVGGSTVCTPGYDPLKFFMWVDEFCPTWYSAPTTMQRSIVNKAASHRDVVSRSRLRVIRCSSAPADSSLIAQVENLFRVPLLDSYGMTETSSTITGEPLTPGKRKPGSVGVPVGCEVTAIDERGIFLPPNEVGEVVVRGTSVIKEYETPDASVNQDSFINGWLRTGDLGKVDSDGYLFLTGRIKELINRGGEKISPVEIDEALNAHPAIVEAMAFALPHKRLGEEIAAAVVLRDGLLPSIQLERQIKEFAGSRLSSQRVPRKIKFVKEIPKAATGKAVRIGLAQRLGLTGPVSEAGDGSLLPVGWGKDSEIPGSIVEMLLLHIWEDTLGERPLGIHDDFFDLGGDSLLATQLICRIDAIFGKNLSMGSLHEAPTVARMTRMVVELSKDCAVSPSIVFGVRTAGSRPPLFILGLQPLFHPMIRSLSDDIPVFGMSFPDPSTLSLPFRMEEIASRHVEALRRFRPDGPYALAGWCNDGLLAYEMAQQLRAQGHEVLVVAMMDAFNPVSRYRRRWKARFNRLRFHRKQFSTLNFKDAIAYTAERCQTIRRKLGQRIWRMLYRMHLATEGRIGDCLRVSDQILTLAASEYRPRAYEGQVLLLRAEIRPQGLDADSSSGWRAVAPNLRVADIPGNHRDMFRGSSAQVMAYALNQHLGCVYLPTTADGAPKARHRLPTACFLTPRPDPCQPAPSSTSCAVSKR